jgi:hypothetical protein
MVQAPFEVRVEQYMPWLDRDSPLVPSAIRPDVGRDVSDELRKHFDQYPLPSDVGPLTTQASPAGDLQLVLNDGVRRALAWRDHAFEAMTVAPSDLVWQVIIAAPLGAFFASLMAEAGKDAYMALKRLAQRLYSAAARRQDSAAPEIPPIELRDAGSGLTVTLPDDLPDKAYRQLLKIELPSLPDGYSPDRLQWFDDHWTLQVRTPVPDERNKARRWRRSTVLVPLVWYSHARQWKPPPKGRRGDLLFIE